jgi:dTDP-4-amino-4,6-dideoxygalactose transaminase
MSWKYLLSDVDLGDEEANAVADVVRGKWLSMGPRTSKFEFEFAEAMQVKHAVALSNCTTALHLALIASGVGVGDEVLVPSYTFVASANAVLYTGATPVFVDIVGPRDLNLCCDDLESKITSRTKAIIAVHIAGFPADMDHLMKIAYKHGLKVIEDACHAIGSSYSPDSSSEHAGKKAGTIGDVGCFSFFANKNLVTGEGGMLVTNDASIASQARLLRSHGMTKSSWDKASGRATDYDVTCLGYNYRCTEITAAIGSIQLRKLSDNNARRLELVEAYRRKLGSVEGLILPFAGRLQDSAHHIFPIVLDHSADQSSVRKNLAEKGIQTSVHYPPVHLFSHYRKLYPSVHLPQTESVAQKEITLPLHPLLKIEDVENITDAVIEIVSNENLRSEKN